MAASAARILIRRRGKRVAGYCEGWAHVIFRAVDCYKGGLRGSGGEAFYRGWGALMWLESRAPDAPARVTP
jgi:hypothetical protein